MGKCDPFEAFLQRVATPISNVEIVGRMTQDDFDRLEPEEQALLDTVVIKAIAEVSRGLKRGMSLQQACEITEVRMCRWQSN